MTEPWNLTPAQRQQFREAHAEAKRTPSKPWRIYTPNGNSFDYSSMREAIDTAQSIIAGGGRATLYHWRDGSWHLYELAATEGLPVTSPKPPPPQGISADRGAAHRAAEASRDHYIVIPASPWGGKTATFGPMSEAEARERLAVWLPMYVPECPPKLLRLIEDYELDDPDPAPVAAGEE
jgi:hypothetical protein